MSNIFGVSVSTGMKLIKEGTYDAVLVALIQNGVQKREYQGKELKPAVMIKLLFEIPSLSAEGETPVIVGKEIPALMSDRANFFKFFKNMGIFSEPTTNELNRVFGTEKSTREVLGTAISLKIGHFDKTDGSKGHFIESVEKLDPRIEQPKADTEPYLFTFSKPDLNVFKNKLSSYGRKRIMSSENVADLPAAFHEAYIVEQEAAGESAEGNSKGVI